MTGFTEGKIENLCVTMNTCREAKKEEEWNLCNQSYTVLKFFLSQSGALRAISSRI